MRIITSICCLYASIAFSQTIALTPFASGFVNACEVVHAGDTRLFVVQQGGAIKIVQPNGTVVSPNFLTLTTATIITGGERGLLGLAFHPNYATNGYFYVNYTRAGDGATVIARYSVSAGNPNVADPSSAFVLLTIPQPFSNHNGGTLRFGPDGYLYIGMGDGGSGGDPGNRSQNINELLGKMLRIDVDSASPYGIPPTNPYAGTTPGLDEIWAIGLRNPWKWSFDSANGDLWIADVGQNNVEEINRVGGTLAGLNYGWKCYEGNMVYSTCSGTTTYTFPLTSYTHSGTGGCSVTGGYVYRGAIFPNFTGKFFFADYCINRIGTVNASGEVAYSATFPGSVNYTSFGQDLAGELYAIGTGTLYKIIDSSLGLNDVAGTGFSMYPNPASTTVSLRNTSPERLDHVVFYDITGKAVLDSQLSDAEVNTIDTSGLQSGLYLVTATDKSGRKSTLKLTIK